MQVLRVCTRPRVGQLVGVYGTATQHNRVTFPVQVPTEQVLGDEEGEPLDAATQGHGGGAVQGGHGLQGGRVAAGEAAERLVRSQGVARVLQETGGCTG